MLNMIENLLSLLPSTEGAIHVMESTHNRTQRLLHTWSFETCLHVLVGK